MNMQPDKKQRAIGLLVAAVMAVLLIWLVSSGAAQAMEWLKGLHNKSQREVSIGVGVLVAMVLPLVVYRLKRAQGRRKA